MTSMVDRAKAEELRVKGQSGALPGQAAKKPFQRAGAASGSQRTGLRSCCASQLVPGHVVGSCPVRRQHSLCLVLRPTPTGHGKAELALGPVKAGTGKGKFVPHPLGDKRTLMFCAPLPRRRRFRKPSGSLQNAGGHGCRCGSQRCRWCL